MQAGRGHAANTETNERGLRLLEFASYNNLKVVNTCGPHKPSRRWTWHSPGVFQEPILEVTKSL